MLDVGNRSFCSSYSFISYYLLVTYYLLTYLLLTCYTYYLLTYCLFIIYYYCKSTAYCLYNLSAYIKHYPLYSYWMTY